jgi:hypothetical protein
MSNLKGFALVVVGILIFTGTCVYADQTYSKTNQGTSSGKDLTDRASVLFDRIKVCQLIVANGSSASTFDAQKMMTVKGPEFEGRFSFRGLEFQLEIIDVSDYPVTYSRSIATGNPIQSATPPSVVSEGQVVTLHSGGTILVSPDEAHAARLVLTVWEA